MAQSSDDSPPVPPSRRTTKAVPPFMAPRTGEEKAPVPVPTHRRSTPLFVPPLMLPPEEEAITPTLPKPVAAAPTASPAVTPEPVRASEVEPPPQPPRETRSFVLENLETEEIALRITGERPAIGDAQIDVIAYDDANGELRADAPEGKRPKVDGIELESTELNMEPSGRTSAPPAGLEIESFWAAEAFTPTVRPAGTPPESSAPIAPAYSEPPADSPPARRSTLESLRVEEVMPPRMPTPPNVRSITPRSGRASVPVNAVRSAPPVDVRTPRQLEALKELEPWALPSMVPTGDAPRLVAEALERVALRIRAGEVNVPGDASAATDENALSAALQALVRAPRR